MTATIQTELRKLEREEGVRILYACESGSRAWGFASRDSDFDVRFLYLRPLDWYLSLEGKRDVLERTLPSDLDLAGWDLRKALPLFAKSNPPLLEWLHSPLVYQEERGFTEALRALLPRYYAPRACMYHYLHMARGNFRTYLRGETVWTKKYLYVLRPVLACRWIAEGRGPVPMEMRTLVETLLGGPLKAAVLELIARKQAGEELDEGPRVPVLHAFIEQQLEALAEAPKRQARVTVEMAPLDALFRETLKGCAPGDEH